MSDQPTKDEWCEIEKRLGSQHCPVHLDCDGYLVSLTLVRTGKMKLGITVYVNGWFWGAWLIVEEDHEEGRRFFPLRSRSVYRGKQKALAKRLLGKAAAEKKVTWRAADWSSFEALRRHLVRHNDHIRWLAVEEYQSRLAERRSQPSKESA